MYPCSEHFRIGICAPVFRMDTVLFFSERLRKICWWHGLLISLIANILVKPVTNPEIVLNLVTNRGYSRQVAPLWFNMYERWNWLLRNRIAKGTVQRCLKGNNINSPILKANCCLQVYNAYFRDKYMETKVWVDSLVTHVAGGVFLDATLDDVHLALAALTGRIVAGWALVQPRHTQHVWHHVRTRLVRALRTIQRRTHTWNVQPQFLSTIIFHGDIKMFNSNFFEI